MSKTKTWILLLLLQMDSGNHEATLRRGKETDRPELPLQ